MSPAKVHGSLLWAAIVGVLLIPVLSVLGGLAQAEEPAVDHSGAGARSSRAGRRRTADRRARRRLLLGRAGASIEHTKGVTQAVSGYAGGKKDTAHYEMVGTGRTGHAESVQVTFDPQQISLRQNPADLFLGRAQSDRAQLPGPR